jgi:hypothetical protein
VDFFLVYIWNNQNIILTFVETKIEMEKLAEYDVCEELVMDYSPILGVTYGLKNVLIEVDTEEDEKE